MDRDALWRRLRQRKLVQWGLFYLAGAWVLLQFADFLADTFDWPAVAMQVLLVVAAFAFLGVLVLAWYHGDRGHQRMTTTEILILIAISSAASFSTWQVAVRVDPAAASPDGAAGADDAAGFTPVGNTNADPRSIAVLPFVNIGASDEDRYFSDGITEDIIAQLAQNDALRVISRTSVMQYRDTEKTIRQIGEELGVAVVLEGSVRRSGEEVRIVAQLIDARTDEHLWAATYDRNIQDILKIQADVAQQIAAALEAELPPVQVATMSEREVDPEAYNLYLRGRELANSELPEDAGRAAEMFSQALRIDSTFTHAYTALAETMVPAVVMGLGDVDVAVAGIPNVDSIVRMAIAKAPQAPEVQTAVVRRELERWNFDGALDAARRAVAASPNHAPARHALGMILARRGDYAAALRELAQARRLDPHSAAISSDLGEVYYAAGRFDDAIRALRSTLERSPRFAEARLNLALAYQAKGQHADAIRELRQAARDAPDNTVVLGHLGQLLAQSGETAEARQILDRLMEPRRRVPASAIAQIHAGLGEDEEAARWLERAAREHSAALVSPRSNRVFGGLRLDSATARRIFMVPLPPPQPDTARRRGGGR
jgi:serine/threonine-protein kinase